MGTVSSWNAEALCQRVQLLNTISAAGPDPGVIVAPEKEHGRAMAFQLGKQLIHWGAVGCDDSIENLWRSFVLGRGCNGLYQVIIDVAAVCVHLHDIEQQNYTIIQIKWDSTMIQAKCRENGIFYLASGRRSDLHYVQIPKVGWLSRCNAKLVLPCYPGISCN